MAEFFNSESGKWHERCIKAAHAGEPEKLPRQCRENGGNRKTTL